MGRCVSGTEHATPVLFPQRLDGGEPRPLHLLLRTVLRAEGGLLPGAFVWAVFNHVSHTPRLSLADPVNVLDPAHAALALRGVVAASAGLPEQVILLEPPQRLDSGEPRLLHLLRRLVLRAERGLLSATLIRAVLYPIQNATHIPAFLLDYLALRGAVTANAGLPELVLLLLQPPQRLDGGEPRLLHLLWRLVLRAESGLLPGAFVCAVLYLVLDTPSLSCVVPMCVCA
ncbi:unnamed protein product [Prorocentrum cordatum]|uniref:Uncharacterized protein n=1 Tax=Prorocentrum cordatum TaxID=2364126 RepID=A0ABN9WYZ3_9DINO|nr:unnamed protein product [Polarella glacialis]